MSGQWMGLLVLFTVRTRRRCKGGFGYPDVLLHLRPDLLGEGVRKGEEQAGRFVKHLRRKRCRICQARLAMMRRALGLCYRLDKTKVVPVPFGD